MDRSLTTSAERRCTVLDLLAFLVPPVLVLGFFLTYLFDREFYLRYILSFTGREYEVVEILTWTTAIIAALILLPIGVSLWHFTIRHGGTFLPGGALFIVMAGLAAFFFGGEEVSWGQIWFHWKTPADMNGISRETNLHNGRFGMLIHGCGNAFLVGLFLFGPILWKYRRQLRLPIPSDWKPSVAEWPVFTTMLLAFLMRLPKIAYMHFDTDAQLHASRFFEGYLEEINEQKEMLVAMGLFIYAFYRIRAVRRAKAEMLAPDVISPS